MELYDEKRRDLLFRLALPLMGRDDLEVSLSSGRVGEAHLHVSTLKTQGFLKVSFAGDSTVTVAGSKPCPEVLSVMIKSLRSCGASGVMCECPAMYPIVRKRLGSELEVKFKGV